MVMSKDRDCDSVYLLRLQKIVIDRLSTEMFHHSESETANTFGFAMSLLASRPSWQSWDCWSKWTYDKFLPVQLRIEFDRVFPKDNNNDFSLSVSYKSPVLFSMLTS